MSKPIESYFGSVRNERENRVSGIVIDGFQNSFRQLLTKFLTLFIDVSVRSAGEVNALK